MKSFGLAHSTLALNALFSMLSGALLLLYPRAAAEAFLTVRPAVVPLQALGGLLVLFGLAVAATAARRPPASIVRAISYSDLAWVAASAAVLLVFEGLFTDAGRTVVILVAAAVGTFAAGQLAGAARMAAKRA